MRATAREWRRPGLSPLREKAPANDTKDRKILGSGRDLREGKAGAQRHGGTCNRRTPQGMTGTWVKAEGGKGGSAPSRETAVDAYMWRRMKRQVAEAGGLRVQETFR